MNFMNYAIEAQKTKITPMTPFEFTSEEYMHIDLCRKGIVQGANALHRLSSEEYNHFDSTHLDWAPQESAAYVDNANEGLTIGEQLKRIVDRMVDVVLTLIDKLVVYFKGFSKTVKDLKKQTIARIEFISKQSNESNDLKFVKLMEKSVFSKNQVNIVSVAETTSNLTSSVNMLLGVTKNYKLLDSSLTGSVATDIESFKKLKNVTSNASGMVIRSGPNVTGNVIKVVIENNPDGVDSLSSVTVDNTYEGYEDITKINLLSSLYIIRDINEDDLVSSYGNLIKYKSLVRRLKADLPSFEQSLRDAGYTDQEVRILVTSSFNKTIKESSLIISYCLKSMNEVSVNIKSIFKVADQYIKMHK